MVQASVITHLISNKELNRHKLLSCIGLRIDACAFVVLVYYQSQIGTDI